MKRKQAFSLTELLVVLCILALLAAMILPVVSDVQKQTRTTQCAANLRQIGIALQSYVSDFDGTYPPSSHDNYLNGMGQNNDALLWEDMLLPYCAKSFPSCPDRFAPSSWKGQHPPNTWLCGYAYNLNLGGATVPTPHVIVEVGTPENLVRFSSLTVAVTDARIDFPARNTPDYDFKEVVIGGAKPGAIRHQNGANSLFADGHVKWFLPNGLTTGKKGDGVHPGFGL